MESIVRKRGSRVLTSVIAVGLAVVMACGVTYAATSSTKGYLACTGKGRVLTLLDAKGKCPSGSTKIKIGARGPRGLTGSPGAQGAPGDTGPKGDTGAKGDTGPAGVVTGYYDYADNPEFPELQGYQALATLPNLPAGNYLITGDVSFRRAINGSPFVVVCQLVTSPSGDSDQGSATFYEANDEYSIPFEIAHQFTGTGSTTVQCDNGDNDIYALHVKIEAIPVASVVRTTG